MMGVVYFSAFIGNALGGALAGWWETMSHTRFFGIHGLIALVPAVLVMLLARPLDRVLTPSPA
jgi:dipeptide/tripeptide permease